MGLNVAEKVFCRPVPDPEAPVGRREEAAEALAGLASCDFEDIPRNIRWGKTILELAHLCAELGDRPRAELVLEQVADVRHQHGLLPLVLCYGGPMSHALARLHETLGQVDAAAPLYEEALATCAAVGAAPTLSRVQLDYAAWLEAAGDAARARGLREEAAQPPNSRR